MLVFLSTTRECSFPLVQFHTQCLKKKSAAMFTTFQASNSMRKQIPEAVWLFCQSNIHKTAQTSDSFFHLSGLYTSHCLFLPQNESKRKVLEGTGFSRLRAIIYKLALASKLTSQRLPWGTPTLSLVLIVMAAKETFPQFANRLSAHQRPGSAGGSYGNELWS